MAEEVDVAVIGAGLAGLTCALRVARAGRRVMVLEREAHVGGRCRAIALGDEQVDAGAHFLADRYAAVRALVRDAGLEPRLEPLGDTLLTAVTRPNGERRIVDFGSALSVLRDTGLTWQQRARLAALAPPFARAARGMRFFDVASAAPADRAAPADAVGPDTVERAFLPPSQALCGYGAEDLSLALLLLGARFRLGRLMTLTGGLGQLPVALAGRLDVRTSRAVTALRPDARGVTVEAGGDTVRAAHAVLATTPRQALDAWPAMPARERALLASAPYSRHAHVYLRTDAPLHATAPDGRPLYMEIFTPRSGVLSHLSFPRPRVTGRGGLVFAAAHPGAVDPDAEALEAAVVDRHPEIRGHITDRHLVTWPEKVPIFRPGRAAEVRAYRRAAPDGRVVLAGDYLYGPLMEGAVLSGHAAADRVLASGA